MFRLGEVGLFEIRLVEVNCDEIREVRLVEVQFNRVVEARVGFRRSVATAVHVLLVDFSRWATVQSRASIGLVRLITECATERTVG